MGKNSNVLGVQAFGNGQMKPREVRDPRTYYEYNDARFGLLILNQGNWEGKQ